MKIMTMMKCNLWEKVKMRKAKSREAEKVTHKDNSIEKVMQERFMIFKQEHRLWALIMKL